MDERLILMGVVGKAHGIRGAVRVTSYTEDPRSLAAYPLTDGKGRHFRLEWQADGVARLAEVVDGAERWVQDRNAAERLTNMPLYTPRHALPDADEDEFYLTDLIGLKAVDEAGAAIGAIAAVHDYGAGASLEISGEAGMVIVPFTREVVPVVDLKAGYVTIRPPAETRVEPPA
ncbi:MAG TPA: ribosome maturation factor RimM [Acetobacteraceae bacterium]|nr:ribosome maturation factor RimM [Acetobacteraceae bacterium]